MSRLKFGSVPRQKAEAHDPEEIASAWRGLEQANAGQEISSEAMKRWIQSWDTDEELPPPKCE